MLNLRRSILLSVFGCLLTAQILLGQEIRKGQPITCYTSGKTVSSNQYVLANKKLYQQPQARQALSDASFELFLSGFPVEAEGAMNFAVNIWGQFIKSDIPIKITANWIPLGTGGTLANASPTEEIKDFVGAPVPGIWYPISLAEKIARQEFNSPSASEIGVNVNSDRNDWYFGTDANPGPGEIDLVTVILHELGHGLGFTANNGTNCFADPTIYAYFIHDGTGQQLVDETIFPGSACSAGGSEAIRSAFTSNNLFFKRSGELNISQLFAPSPFQGGSSISHLDETTYDGGDPNQLMTPTIDGVIHDPGPLTQQMFAEMGWVYTYFDHLPFTDVESFNAPFLVTIESDTSLSLSELLLHYSTDDFQTENTSVLSATANPDEYSSTIADPGADVTLTYYFSAVDALGRSFTLPQDAPDQNFSFFIGQDQEPPSITHNPLTLVLTSSASVEIKATLTDNIGIDNGTVEYRINQGTESSVLMVADPDIENQHTVAIQLPGGLNKGDILEYRIIATDESTQANQASSPASGFFEVEINEFDPVPSYANDFNAPSSDFVGDEYSISLEVGFIDNAIHSSHPYPVGTGVSLETNLIYQLAIPIVVAAEGAEIKFDEVALVEPGADGSVFGEGAFNDYAIVEGSNDNGVSWQPLVAGYDASADVEWLDKYNSNVKGVNSEAVGNRLIFKPRVINILETFSTDESILIRFRLFSNSVAYGWGWVIDNLEIQNQVVGVEDVLFKVEGMRVFPNPSQGIIQLKINNNSVRQLIQLEMLNSLGQHVYRKELVKNSKNFNREIDLEEFPTGLYLLNMVIDSNRYSLRIILE